MWVSRQCLIWVVSIRMFGALDCTAHIGDVLVFMCSIEDCLIGWLIHCLIELLIDRLIRIWVSRGCFIWVVSIVACLEPLIT